MASRGVVIFDLDGTLVDAFGDIRAALNHALAEQGLPLHSMQAVRGFVGNGLSQLVRRAVPPAHAALCPAVEESLRAYYAAHPADHASVYDGMREAVVTLRAEGFSTAILSNKADDLVQAITKRLELNPLFDAICGERPGVPLKPDPEAVRPLLRAFDTQRGVFVGDGVPDGEVARNAGLPFVGVTWGLGTEEELERFGRIALTGGEVAKLVLEYMGK
ncbi:MAG: phosphoglycolate phosphatase [Candidatus Sumerlaeota bacterium]|nr:phosphoglycolate phosphatase [Candidatus Sumerlaeota bacterium]